MDIDKKLARLSASIAAMTCSFSADWSELYVIKEHDVYVVNCLETEYNNAGLNALAAEERQEISPDEATILISNMKGSLKIG